MKRFYTTLTKAVFIILATLLFFKNELMKYLNKFVLVILILLFGYNLFSQNKTEINNVISEAGTFSDPKPSDRKTISETEETTSNTKCRIKTIKLVKRFDDYITFSDNSDLYPGAIIQGKYLLDGKVISIGSFKRQPLTITLTGLDLGSGLNSKLIQNPNKASVTNAVNDMLRDFNGTSSSKFTFKKVEAYSKKQALLELGLKANWLAGGVGGNLEMSSNNETHTIFIYFKQSYYSISTEAPTTPASFFNPSIDADDLKYRINKENPAGYISSVTYGRILVAKMTSTFSSEKMKAAINAKFGFGAIKANAGVDNNQILSNSSFEVYSAGGLLNSIPTDIGGVTEFIQTGLNFTSSSQAVPIAYEVKYLKDNSPFMVGDEATYKIRNCFDNTPYQDFDIYFYGFLVVDDCENTMMAPGEFYFQIKVNDKVVFDLSETEHQHGYTGKFIDLKKKVSISIPNIPKSKIEVSGWVREQDSYVDDTFVGKFDIIHNYPFSNQDLYNAKENGSFWYIKPIGSHHCGVKLYYQIKKK